MENQVSEAVKQERYDRLMTLQHGISWRKTARRVGETCRVLVERRRGDRYVGRSACEAPETDGNIYFGSDVPLEIGTFADVRILGAKAYDLQGVCVGGRERSKMSAEKKGFSGFTEPAEQADAAARAAGAGLPRAGDWPLSARSAVRGAPSCGWRCWCSRRRASPDLFDGKIARKYNLVTNFGKFMDPIADKILTHTAFILFTSMGMLSAFSCIIFVAREFVVAALREIAADQGTVIAAGMSGKVKTVLQMALIILLTLPLEWTPLRVLTRAVEIAAVVMTLYSMAEYVWKNRGVLGGDR